MISDPHHKEMLLVSAHTFSASWLVGSAQRLAIISTLVCLSYPTKYVCIFVPDQSKKNGWDQDLGTSNARCMNLSTYCIKQTATKADGHNGLHVSLNSGFT
jgi:hypothetical protein